MFSVSALGELLIDFTDAGTSAGGQRLFERNAGGAPANVLVALEKLGHKTAFLGKVGCDMHGEFLRATLDEQGIDTTGLISDPDAFTTLAFVALSPHVGSLSLTDEPARTATLAALACAREAGCTLSYDPNYRANLWPSVDAAVEQMRAVVPQMDLMKLSDEECALLTGFDDPEAAATALLEQGPKVVAVTLGGSGAYVRTADGSATVPGFPADAVDATGAGDSFWGGFLAGFCESGKAASEVTVEDAANFARLGNAVASLCVRKRGAIPAMPTRNEVEALLGA